MPDELEALERLANLRDRGALSAEEFDAKKAELLTGQGRHYSAGAVEAAPVGRTGPLTTPNVNDAPARRRGPSRSALIVLAIVGVLLFPWPKTNAAGVTSTTNLIAEIGIALSGPIDALERDVERQRNSQPRR